MADELSVAHEDWSGPSDCSRCHDVGGRTSDERCLTCHAPLARRILAREGYHATRASDCASCHREHGGRQARLVSFEPAGFDHSTIGYPLAGAHGELECSGCHNTLGVRDREVRLFKGRYGALSRTYLGLADSCAACHAAGDPHGEQFVGRDCATCHDERLWGPATRFDHAASRYPLTGRHRVADCASCHVERLGVEASDAALAASGPVSQPALARPRPVDGGGAEPPGARVLYRPLDFAECSSCHRDAHAGELGRRCTSCHSTEGWSRIPRRRFEGDFDHSATDFPLEGRHLDAECTACHRARPAGDAAIALIFARGGMSRYPRPAAEACGSCHLDYHEGAFEGSAFEPECAGCHTAADWAPSGFDLFAHDRADFRLTGAHRVVPCEDCHRTEIDAGDADLEAPPAGADPGTRADWEVEPIRPAPPPFRIHLGQPTCASCHTADDPHAGQFDGHGCESCHSTTSYAVDAFDHAETAFPLDGDHAEVACASCHLPERGAGGSVFTRYRPLDVACRACHGTAIEPAESNRKAGAR